jgi:hypothetical protein
MFRVDPKTVSRWATLLIIRFPSAPCPAACVPALPLLPYPHRAPATSAAGPSLRLTGSALGGTGTGGAGVSWGSIQV